ncbi:MAG TPA: 4-alpha-glucanotransferase [Candidatus Limnocylindria bacterium]|nr:4-alpha-glucanotransferase [Candidatus Limnocylindria bacterium]
MRESGILLHLTSLPSPEGLGSLGAEARAFASFLHEAGMRIWQVLPISPTGYAESPYQSFSTFAGNPLLIDLRTLKSQGILTTDEALELPGNPDAADYPAVIAHKARFLEMAWEQSGKRLAGKVRKFRMENADWLEDFALFMAVKRHFDGISWMEWPDEGIRMREQAAMARYREMLRDQVEAQVFIQYLFFRQWFALKLFANRLGVQVFGDMPIYVAEDSADAWANPDIFQFDRARRPVRIAGVPPDYFSEDGQRWGNPLYNWEYLKRTGYAWWLRRLKAMGRVFDLTRVDHFIGFANYYSIPAGEPTARNGVWENGPGRSLFRLVREQLPDMRIVAEDLGAVNNRVRRLLDYCAYPGMKVLQFAFSGDPFNEHLPKNHAKNSVIYTGTHDNNTLLGWWARCTEQERVWALLALQVRKDEDITVAFLRAAMHSPADRAVVPMQDVLRLPEGARMNQPGTLGGNWMWRMRPGAATRRLARELRQLNEESGRLG